jgi:hypothetical protein
MFIAVNVYATNDLILAAILILTAPIFLLPFDFLPGGCLLFSHGRASSDQLILSSNIIAILLNCVVYLPGVTTYPFNAFTSGP